MITLKELIKYLTEGTNIKICIHDITGILMNKKFDIDAKNKIHFTFFCDTAKSTQRGYDLCIACKSLANEKASREKKPFCGCCAWGIFEAVYPVVIKNEVQCIVYVGNAITDKSEFRARAGASCRITSVSEEDIFNASSTCEESADTERIKRTAQIVGDFIVLSTEFYMYDKLPRKSAGSRMSKSVEEYIELNYRQPITLRSLSKLYFINEKYLGRVLKREWGMSFHQYLNSVRLRNAAKILRTENRTVLETALDCGFANVTYFNRLFYAKFGKTPSEYRRGCR